LQNTEAMPVADDQIRFILDTSGFWIYFPVLESFCGEEV